MLPRNTFEVSSSGLPRGPRRSSLARRRAHYNTGDLYDLSPNSRRIQTYDAALREMLSWMPAGSRFSTVTEPPNSETIRCATGGPNPRSPPGKIASPIENTWKKFAIADSGMPAAAPYQDLNAIWASLTFQPDHFACFRKLHCGFEQRVDRLQ